MAILPCGRHERPLLLLLAGNFSTAGGRSQTYKEHSLFLPGQILVCSELSISGRLRLKQRAQASAGAPVGGRVGREDGGRELPPGLDDVRPIDAVWQPGGDQEDAAQQVMSELDEPLGLVARVA